MSANHPETVKVVSDNPGHTQGYIVKNRADLTDDDELFQEPKAKAAAQQPPAKKSSAQTPAPDFEAMGLLELRNYLTSVDVKFHHMAGVETLRAACRKAASDLV